MIPFSLERHLELGQAEVERWLSERMDALAARVPPRLLEAMRYSLLGGGKRLRPILCRAFAQAVARDGDRPGDEDGGGAPVADAACALEAVHTYSLIHDDLPAMDDDDLRRGQPTSHKRFGEALAILAGDALLTEAFAMVSGGTEPFRAQLTQELAQAAGAAGMVGGQVLDIAEDRPAELSYLLRLHALKTGELIRVACRMGVIAGGGDLTALAAADRYGRAVGVAFQIADDLLDVSASAAELGKPTGADAAAGRHTFPAVLGMEQAKAMAHQQVQVAIEAVARLEPVPGPLAGIARYAVERRK